MPKRSCEATRYSTKPCSGPAEFDVVYTSSKGAEQDRHPACFTHGLAEVERHTRSGGMSRCEMTPARMPSPVELDR